MHKEIRSEKRAKTDLPLNVQSQILILSDTRSHNASRLDTCGIVLHWDVVKNWAESVLNCEESSSGKLDETLRPRRSEPNCRGNDTGHAYQGYAGVRRG